MGKSGRKKKKMGAPNPSDDNKLHPASTTTTPPSSIPNGGGPTFTVDASLLLKRAHDLKEEGNRRFQAKDYAGALEQYELALKLTPRFHPDRAVFHSNRAACLLQMRPPDYQAAATECSLALQAQPGFPRALLRRARACEALGKPELALADANALLASDPNNSDALDIARRLRTVVGVRGGDVGGQQQQQQELSSRPSPAALGASAVGAPIAGLGPCLPSRSTSRKTSPPPLGKPDKLLAVHDIPSSHSNSTVVHPSPPQNSKPQHKPVVLKPFKSNTPTSSSSVNPVDPDHSAFLNVSNNGHLNHSVGKKSSSVRTEKPTKRRPLKLVYDHDIRLAQMPAKCTFRELRDIVTKRFPSSKSVLIKYRDEDGDLITVTNTAEVRLAESVVDEVAAPKEEDNGNASLGMLRLHIVDVNPEQEPQILEEPEQEQEEIEDEPKKDQGSVEEDRTLTLPIFSGCESIKESSNKTASNTISAEEVLKDKVNGHKECNHAECKQVEIDDWLFEFCHLFRNQVGIDSDAHLDLHELGMELCTEALEEVVTSEEAQTLFEMAASKFQEVAALAFFNWGNVHMCAARKRIPLDEHAPKDVFSVQLQFAYDWVKERYALAGQKYEEALRIKPDFYEGLLALGQQHFETAKLQWSFALASKVDLPSWDSAETFALFQSAEEKMKAAIEIWEKLEEERSRELKDPATSNKEELLKRRNKQALGADSQTPVSIPGELTTEEAAEQAAVVRSQIHLFWGNLLFERSQVEFKLGFSGWKKNLDAAVEQFKLAGASEADISAVIKNHSFNEVNLDEKKEGKLESVFDNDESNAVESAST